jgi:hypothetical protein
MLGITEFQEDPQAPDEENARRFFGFAPGEELDVFTLRARKLKREDEAMTQRQREMVQRYFAILAGEVGIAMSTAAAPPAREDQPAPVLQLSGDDDEEVNFPSPPAEVQRTMRQLRQQLNYALHTEVIQHTITAYHNLFGTLVTLARLLGVDPKRVDNAWVRSHMQAPTPTTVSRTQLEEVLELLPEGLHVSLGGTPEFNHPSHRYIANAPESRLGLQFEYILNAIRDKAQELLDSPPRDRWAPL